MKVSIIIDSRDYENTVYRVFSSFEAAHKFLDALVLPDQQKNCFYIIQEEVHDL